jgi:hypothetical protein
LKPTPLEGSILKNSAPLFFVFLLVFLLVGCEVSEFGRPPKLLLYEVTGLVDDLLDVWLEDDEGWAVGPVGEDGLLSTVLFYDGSDWQPIEGPEGDLQAVLGDGAGGCVAVGREGLWVRYDGTQWTRYPNPTYEDLVAIDGTWEDYWVVGRNGVLLHYSGGEWELESVGDYGFTDVVTTGYEVAAVTADGSVVFKDVDGGEISTYDLGLDGSLNGIAATSGDGYLVVGDDGVILLGNVDDWTVLSSPTGESLKDVSAVSAENFMAVGSRGTVVLSQGGELRVLDSPTEENLIGVVLLSLNEGWVVGRDGTVLHYY